MIIALQSASRRLSSANNKSMLLPPRIKLFLLAIFWWPHSAWAQQLGQRGDTDISLLRVFGSLVFCLLLAIAIIFLIKKKYPAINFRSFYDKQNSSRLILVDQISLAPQRSIYLIALDGQEYLTVFSGSSATILAVSNDAASKLDIDDAV
ncbi:hypothetical protein ACFOWX_01465 [Sphingorhabdus arenilitoris]|uniref:Flagellar biosynthetic protein FliO n=1 Tax=Sphingorhabdus arenilitoris TaxID=1490041 RepID=A0ABV8RFT1_9SPHN